MKTLLRALLIGLISPLALLGAMLWLFLMWNAQTANGENGWKALLEVLSKPK